MAPLSSESSQARTQDEEETSLTTLSSLAKPKRSVAFHPTMTVTFVESRNDYSKSEIASIWMSATEYDFARLDAADTLFMLRTGTVIPQDHEELCGLGLATIHWEKRRKLRKLSRKAVIWEQDIQHSDGYDCEDLIAMAYSDYTEMSCDWAQERGLENAHDIQEYVGDLSHMCQRSNGAGSEETCCRSHNNNTFSSDCSLDNNMIEV
jgi:hypothetical protein